MLNNDSEKNKKIAFLTLGCKVNKYETDLLKEKFENAGYSIVDFDEIADIYCVNSCSVTNMSDRKTRQMISKARKLNPVSIIAVIGCSVESNKEELIGFKEADIILGNDEKMDLLDVVNNYDTENRKQHIKLLDISKVKTYKAVGNLKSGYDIREAIKIEDGCNNFCSYCVIPYVRGRVRSRSLDAIKSEAESLVSHGVKELILVGIEVASYGLDLEDCNLFNVLDVLEQIKGLERIRLSSIEPRFLSEANIVRLAGYKKLCNHFHISMQSGNDEVLKRMNRKYTKDVLINATINLRKYFDNPYIAADLIVGFPKESDDEFEDTITTICKMQLSEIHVFKYSKRKYTLASKMEGQVDGNIKKQRSEKILEISQKNNNNYLSSYINRNVRVLFESFSNGYLIGYTTNYIKVKVKGDKSLCGTIQDVVITSLEKDIALGILSKT